MSCALGELVERVPRWEIDGIWRRDDKRLR
jgi:hypothetical protein